MAAGQDAMGLNASVGANDRSERLFVRHLGQLGIDRVLDIGANAGQFAGKLRALGYEGTILSVEPQSGCYPQLLANARLDPRWIVLPRQGAGAEPGFLELNIAENSYSTSMLAVHDNHLRAERTTRTVGTERVFVNRASDLMRPELLASVEAIKIDVQGYERQVLEGLLPHLPRVRLLQVELSMVECYVGAPDMFALDRWIVAELGFERVSLEPSYYDETRGVVQQYDGIYHRPAQPGPPAVRRLGIQVGAVSTSIGGAYERRAGNGADAGPHWFKLCVKSWTQTAPKVVSVSEQAPAADPVEWARTERKPALAEVFRTMESMTDKHVLLTNADIALTSAMKSLFPVLDPNVVYFGNRTDVTDPKGNGELVVKGLYLGGFDYFVLPHEFVREINRTKAFPEHFRVGEPWWDYLLPILALASGYPVKRIQRPVPLAMHFAHETRFAHALWIENGERFCRTLETLRAVPHNPIPGFLDELLAAAAHPDPVTRLNQVAAALCAAL